MSRARQRHFAPRQLVARGAARLGSTVALFCALWAVPAGALITFEAPLDRAHWRAEAGRLQCRLVQPIPRYGDIVVEAAAGEPQRLFIDAPRPRFGRGAGVVVAAAPFWNPGRAEALLGSVTVTDGARPVVLEATLTQKVLDSLSVGLAPALSAPLADAPGTARLSLLPVGFGGAYDEYLACRERLPVISFADVSRFSLYFVAHGASLSAGDRARLDQLITFVKAARSAPRVSIVGHGDDSQRQLLNLEYSRRRADVVRSYLVSKGISSEQIAVSYRGDRDARRGGRNRRVDIGIEPLSVRAARD